MAMPDQARAAGRVAILLSTFNGERFLDEQLASLQAQTVTDWRLYWRDDGSSDGTGEVMAAFRARLGPDRVVAVPNEGRLGASASFLHLLRAADADAADFVAFADQDDVWLPEKLARGLDTLATRPPGTAALYFARQVLVDANLQRICLSSPLRQAPEFPASLTQNVATGCTLMLNRAAIQLIAASRAPATTLHDWWCYLLVTAAGGVALFDSTPVVLYRQHGQNLVGAPASWLRRVAGALHRGPQAFMNVLRNNVAALAEQPQLLSEQAREQVATIARALDGGALRRLPVLRMRGLVRQTWSETALFRLWFLLH
jgi:glycosyltransferase involved in cell wall biosynthesis